MTGSGFPIAFREQGDGPAVVFLHGVGGDSLVWQDQLAHFGADYRAIAWDMPGYGGSAPLDDVGFAALADALACLLDHLDIQRAHVVGHSIGGMVAQEFIACHPDRVASLVLSATSPAFGNPDGDFQKKFVAARMAPLDAGKTMADVAADLVPAMIAEGADPEGVARARDCMSRVSPQTYRAMMNCLVTFDRRAALGGIKVPSLLLAGGADRNAPAAMMERMAARIPGADYVCLDGVGHLANLEQPTAFDAAVRRFLDRLQEQENRKHHHAQH